MRSFLIVGLFSVVSMSSAYAKEGMPWTAKGTTFTVTSKTLPNGKKEWTRKSLGNNKLAARVTSNSDQPYEPMKYKWQSYSSNVDQVIDELSTQAAEHDRTAEFETNGLKVRVFPSKPGDEFARGRAAGAASGAYHVESHLRWEAAKERERQRLGE